MVYGSYSKSKITYMNTSIALYLGGSNKNSEVGFERSKIIGTKSFWIASRCIGGNNNSSDVLYRIARVENGFYNTKLLYSGISYSDVATYKLMPIAILGENTPLQSFESNKWTIK